MNLPDDTQPNSPFKNQPVPSNILLSPESEAAAGPGCGSWAVVSLMAVLFALAIVGLAAAAGWTSGVRVAQNNATATHQSDVNSQLQFIQTDVAAGNIGLVDIRIKYLATQTPAIAQVLELQQTATALYLTYQPTNTPTPTETLAATITPTTEVASTLESTVTTAPEGALDLPALLTQARQAVNSSNWENAITTLDILISADPQFETTTVNGLMTTALNSQALKLFRTDESGLAEAILLANRAEQFGILADGVSFEREVATLYLSAKSRVNTSDYTGGIRYLTDLLALSPNYLDARDLLVKQYIAYGDALVVSQPCSAMTQYDNAINLTGSGTASAQRVIAENWCTNGTPTPEGFIATIDPNVTPIGQP
ncbi:MAG: hypothetical protein H7X77_09570 [Anaerolineae bacterium]|nr:hypothetical protein [Anaerolineae bacterium]